MKSLCGIAWIICACHLGEGISDVGCFEGNLEFSQEYKVYESVTPKDVHYYVFDIYGCFDRCRFYAYVGVSHKNDNGYYFLSCLCGHVRPTGFGDSKSCSDRNDDGTWTSPHLNRSDVRTALYENNGSLCIGTTLDLQLPGTFPLTSDRSAEWHWSELSSSKCVRQCEEMCLPVIGISYRGDEADKYMTCQCSAQLPLDQENKFDSCPHYGRWTSSSGGASHLWSVYDNSDKTNITRTVVLRNPTACPLITTSSQEKTEYPELQTTMKTRWSEVPIVSNDNVTHEAPGADKQSYHIKSEIIGGVAGGLILVLLVGAVIVVIYMCLRQNAKAEQELHQHVYFNTGITLQLPVHSPNPEVNQSTDPDNQQYMTLQGTEEPNTYAELNVNS